jgi:hypothetical protein
LLFFFFFLIFLLHCFASEKCRVSSLFTQSDQFRSRSKWLGQV